jgi:hypothetical protein
MRQARFVVIYVCIDSLPRPKPLAGGIVELGNAVYLTAKKTFMATGKGNRGGPQRPMARRAGRCDAWIQVVYAVWSRCWIFWS